MAWGSQFTKGLKVQRCEVAAVTVRTCMTPCHCASMKSQGSRQSTKDTVLFYAPHISCPAGPNMWKTIVQMAKGSTCWNPSSQPLAEARMGTQMQSHSPHMPWGTYCHHLLYPPGSEQISWVPFKRDVCTLGRALTTPTAKVWSPLLPGPLPHNSIHVGFCFMFHPLAILERRLMHVFSSTH